MTAPQNTVEPGTVVLVTGGARGIGATLARSLARQGATVVVADVVDAGPLVAELRADGLTVDAVPTDVSDEAAWSRLVEAAVDRHGRVDALVNNAAVYQGLGAKAPFTLNDPGYVATAAQGRSVPRGMLPEDLCPAVSFLCSRGSGFITGQTVVVDGGVTFL